MDAENPVVKLCVEGMAAEGEGRQAEARALFRQAWESRTDNYEACVAAHYLARHQESADETLRWNQVALDKATSLGDDDRVHPFFASLHLNLGRSLEDVDRFAEARAHYRLAADNLGAVVAGPYRSLLARGIDQALRRTAAEAARPG